MNRWIEPPHSPFSISPGQIVVWKAALDWPADRLEACLAWLDPAERQRAGRFHFPIDRDRFVARRLLLRAILARGLGISPAQVAYHTDPYGKLSLAAPGRAAVCFNASHSAGLALVALGRRALGVDLEYMRADLDLAGVAARFFSPWENAAWLALPPEQRRAAFFALWTRKEAYVKALGQGLSLALDAFDVSLEPDLPARLLAARQGLPGPETWTLQSLDPSPGYAGALCTQGQVGDLQLWSLADPAGWISESPG